MTLPDDWHLSHSAPFYEVDITSGEFFLQCGDQYDVIIHLAAITSLPDCESNPLETLRINVSGTANVLEFAREFGSSIKLLTLHDCI